MSSFWKDVDLQKFGDALAASNHPEKLADARFNFVFTDAKPGKTVVKARLVPKMWKDLGVIDADFLLVINAQLWQEISSEERTASLDHELCHCSAVSNDKGDKKYSIIPHDIEDFHVIYERYGDWQNTINKLIEGLKAKKKAKVRREETVE